MAKPAKAPDPAPSEGHNVIGVDRNEFDAWSARHSAATEAVKVAQAKRKKLRKEMRAAGIILGVFDRTEKLAAMSREEQQTEMQHTEAYLRWHRAPIGAQFTLSIVSNDAFDDDDEAAEARAIEDAKGAGWRAGLAGVVWEDDNPHPANSKPGQAWLGAYREGQKKNVEALGDDADSGS